MADGKPSWRGRAGGILLLCGLAVLFGVQVLSPRRDASVVETISPSRETQLLPRDVLPRQSTQGGFVSSDACRDCHKQQHASWHRSFHRTMTQVASPDTVVGSFDNVTLQSRNRTYHLERRGDQFQVTMADPDFEDEVRGSGINLSEIASPPVVSRRVVMTTGSHHMQGYWVPGNFGVLRQIPWYFLISEQRWVPREDVFIEPPGAPRHFMVWNENCIVCHSVGGAPGVDAAAHSVSTTVAELGIACEACHGPGQQHVHVQKSLAGGAHASTVPPDTIVNPAKLTSRLSSQICGQCHSVFGPASLKEFLQTGYSYRAGGDLEATRNTVTFDRVSGPEGNERSRGYFWPDGTCRTGGREFLAMQDSPCYLKGELSCLTCHSMHGSDPDDQLRTDLQDNNVCLQCHTGFKSRLEEHTHHSAGSSGSLCYSCHMPYTSYALLKAIRSHRITSPRVGKPATDSQPNACNLCHQTETLAWTASKLSEWYSLPKPDLDEDHTQIAASVLWLVRGNVVQRIIAAWHMGWEPAFEVSGQRWQARYLLELLNDEYSAARFVAARSLKNHPDFAEFQFDFVGSPADRTTARRNGIAIWKSRTLELSDDVLRRLLFKTSRNDLDQERFQKLLEQRDQSPGWLPE